MQFVYFTPFKNYHEIILSSFTFIYLYVCVRACAPLSPTCRQRGERTACWSESSPFVWVPRMELSLPALAAGAFTLLAVSLAPSLSFKTGSFTEPELTSSVQHAPDRDRLSPALPQHSGSRCESPLPVFFWGEGSEPGSLILVLKAGRPEP